MDDDPFVSGTAAGILAEYIDLQRQFPGRFQGVVDTSNDDYLIIRSYDTQTYEFLRVYAPADGVGTIVLVEQTIQPVVEVNPFDTISFSVDTFVYQAPSHIAPQKLLPGGFFGGDGGGYGGGGYAGAYGGAIGGGGGGFDGHTWPDLEWLESVGFIY